MLCIFTLTTGLQDHPACGLLCVSQWKQTKFWLRCLASTSMSIVSVCRRDAPPAPGVWVLIKRWLTLASFAPTRAGGISGRRSSLFPRRHFFFFYLFLFFPFSGPPNLHMAVQTVHLRAGAEWCGESARIQLVRRSQPKSSGPNCHFVQTTAQLSAAEPPATLRGEQSSADLTLAERAEAEGAGRDGGWRLNFHLRLCGGMEG